MRITKASSCVRLLAYGVGGLLAFLSDQRRRMAWKERWPAFVLLFTISTVQAAQPTKPNILLIVADDLGYADVGIHGCKEFATPNIDSIAKGGIRFTNGYVSAPLCAPSRAGFLTGHYQDRFGFRDNPPPGTDWGLSLDEKTIADRLKPAGYRTAVLGKWHLGEKPEYHPMKRGFDEFFGFLSGMHSYVQALDKKWGPILRGNKQVELKEYLTFALAREAGGFIKRNADSPFFLYLAFNAPHIPLEAPDSYLQKASHISDKRRRTYVAMVMALDDAIGQVLAALRETKQEENTLVFFFSDNGGPLLAGSAPNGAKNDPLRGSKAQLWEGGIRVPFFAQWKGRIPAGKTSNEPVISLDILPTALAASGTEIKSEWKLDGLNLLPLVEGRQPRLSRPEFCWRFGKQQTAIRRGDWKLVHVGSEGGLYNLPEDIGESKDRAADHAAEAKELQSLWEKWDGEMPPSNRPRKARNKP